MSELRNVNYLARLVKSSSSQTEAFLREFGLSGSGIDRGMSINWEKTNLEGRNPRITLEVPFHPMDEHGCYKAWEHTKAVLRPCMEWGYSLKVTGTRDRYLREYLEETLAYWLEQNSDPARVWIWNEFHA